MADPKSPILDLPALQARPIARIHGINYQLRHPAELTLWDRSRLATLGGRLDVLDAPQLTEDQATDASAALKEICGLVLLAPAKVIDALTDQHRLAVALTFIALSPAMRRLLAGAQDLTATTSPQTPATSSPDSSASTAAAPRNGSGKSRSRTSARA